MNPALAVEYYEYAPPEVGRYRHLVAAVDATANPNPGHGGGAVVFFEEGSQEPVGYASIYLGNDISSNAAELFAIMLAYTEAAAAGVEHLTVMTDNKWIAHVARGEERETLPRALQDPVAALDAYKQGVTSSEVRWVPRTAVWRAHEKARAIVQGREWLDKPKVGQRKLFEDVEPLIQVLAPYTLSTPFVYTARVTLWLVPFYSYTNDGAVPSVEDRQWGRAAQLSRESGSVLLVWRPYGNTGVPLSAVKVSPALLPPGDWDSAPLVCADVTTLRAGPGAGRVGYSGAEVIFLTEGLWTTLEEGLQAWQAPHR